MHNLETVNSCNVTIHHKPPIKLAKYDWTLTIEWNSIRTAGGGLGVPGNFWWEFKGNDEKIYHNLAIYMWWWLGGGLFVKTGAGFVKVSYCFHDTPPFPSWHMKSKKAVFTDPHTKTGGGCHPSFVCMVSLRCTGKVPASWAVYEGSSVMRKVHVCTYVFVTIFCDFTKGLI